MSESSASFDRLPTEIIFMICNYLLNNDIIFTFFYLNKRFDNLLLQNQRYLNHIELQTKNMNIRKNILRSITTHVESLCINTMDLSFSLEDFPNIKSLIIFSSYGLAQEQAQFIVNSKYFNNLHRFKIKQDKIFSNKLIFKNNLLENIFNGKNLLKIFEYLLDIPSISYMDTKNFQINSNLHSLTLKLADFTDIFTLIEYIPNLIYLNIKTPAPERYETPIDNNNIKLKQVHLTLYRKYRSQKLDFDLFTNCMKYFSSSLVFLSINSQYTCIKIDKPESFNCTKLQQFLESMIKLKQFHLNTQLIRDENSNEFDHFLFQLQNNLWLKKNYLFGTHYTYFYTLPFHFDYLYDFPDSFRDIRSSNPEILENNPSIWYKVKSIDLPKSSKYDISFLKN